MLLPPKPSSKLAGVLASVASNIGLPIPDVHPFWASQLVDVDSMDDAQTEVRDDTRLRRAWRVPQETLDQLSGILREYEGTHCFHNYTIGRSFTEKASNRYMLSVQIRNTHVINDVEWISVLFHGQSFMLHQGSVFLHLIYHNRSNTYFLEDCKLCSCRFVLLQSTVITWQRKMISMAILVCRTNAATSVIRETYNQNQVIIPMAPALGLLLEQVSG